MGIGTSLRWLAEKTVEEGDIDIDVDIRGEEAPLSDTPELVLFRIAQEALTNARKHAGATPIDLGLTFADGRVRLRIADNGRGFVMKGEDKLSEEGKYGLIGMEERARPAGGTFTIESGAGKGTVITAEVPIG